MSRLFGVENHPVSSLLYSIATARRAAGKKTTQSVEDGIPTPSVGTRGTTGFPPMRRAPNPRAGRWIQRFELAISCLRFVSDFVLSPKGVDAGGLVARRVSVRRCGAAPLYVSHGVDGPGRQPVAALPRGRRSVLLVVVPFAALTLISLPAVSHLALGSLEWRYPPREWRPTRAEAIVVLSGGTLPPDAVRLRDELSSPSLVRCTHAAEVYHQGPPLPVMVTGGKVDPRRRAARSRPDARVPAEARRGAGGPDRGGPGPVDV